MKEHYPREAGYQFPKQEPFNDEDCPEGGDHALKDYGNGVVYCEKCGLPEDDCEYQRGKK